MWEKIAGKTLRDLAVGLFFEEKCVDSPGKNLGEISESFFESFFEILFEGIFETFFEEISERLG